MKYILDNVKYNKIKQKVNKIIINPGLILKEWKENRGYINLYKKKENRDNSKAIIFVHGGGFLWESPNEESYIFFCYVLCELTGYDIYCPDYVLPPTETYPSQINDIIKVRKYIENNYKYFLLGGDSAGGCTALTCLLKYYDLFNGGFLISPWLNLNCNTSSYKTRAWCEEMKTGDPIFKLSPKENSKSYYKDAKIYLGNNNLFNNKFANPYYATENVIEKLPPLLILVGDNETIRNDSLDFASKAQKVNKNIFVSLYDTMWHDWLLYTENNSGEYGIDAYYNISEFCKGLINKSEESYEKNHMKNNVNVNIVL